MWKEGTIGIPNEETGKTTICHWWIKVYDEPSEFGVDEGRISKLTIKVDGEITANYDRGWDVKPKDKATQTAFEVLMLQN